jgi:hypothetical protein
MDALKYEPLGHRVEGDGEMIEEALHPEYSGTGSCSLKAARTRITPPGA